MSEVTEEFYPELRKDYSNRIGLAGEIAINIVLDDYDVVPHLLNEPGVDVEVESLSVAVEIWNHRRQHGYLERLKGVIRNLSSYSLKFHVASFISPEFKKTEETNGITVIELGFQIIPKEYITFYQQHYGLKRKKTLNKRTLKIVANRLKPILDAIQEQQYQKTLEQFNGISHTALVTCNNHSHVCSTCSTSYSKFVPIVIVSFSGVPMINCKLRALKRMRKKADCNVFSANKSGDSKAPAIYSVNTGFNNYKIGRMLRTRIPLTLHCFKVVIRNWESYAQADASSD